MIRQVRLVAVALAGLAFAQASFAQDSVGAASTRKKLQQKISIEAKDVQTKAVFEDIKNEMDKPVTFKIDTGSGMSLNTKLTYSAKNKTVEEVLNEMADKFEFGWFVKSDPKDRYDGWVIIRKAKEKERGYEAGKGPKKTGRIPDQPEIRPAAGILDRLLAARIESLVLFVPAYPSEATAATRSVPTGK